MSLTRLFNVFILRLQGRGGGVGDGRRRIEEEEEAEEEEEERYTSKYKTLHHVAHHRRFIPVNAHRVWACPHHTEVGAVLVHGSPTTKHVPG